MSGFLKRAIAERRATSVLIGNPQDPAYWIQKLFLGGGPVVSGVDVTPQSALSWTALSAGIRISGETLGSLSWSVFEHVPSTTPGRPGEKIERTEHPIYSILHSEPNEEQTSMEFLEMVQAHALWWGGSASQIIRNQAGIITELWPLNPDRCRWERHPDGSLALRVTIPRDKTGGVMGSTLLSADDVLWVRGFSTGGIWGVCLPEWHKEAIGLGLASEAYIAAFFGRGAHAGGIITHPKSLSKEAQARLREGINNQVGGLDRAHRTLILEEGATWVQTTIDPQKAEFLGLRQFQIAEASRILRIPPHMLGDLTRGTFSNNEQQAIEFVQNHVRPWVVRWEQRFNKQLFGRKEKGRLYVKANMNALARGDMQARFEAYAKGIASRIITPNEARENEDLNPGPPDLDLFQVTPNLNPPKPAGAGTGGTDGQDPGVAQQPAAA
jgi:HK97 family phage portal protein